MRYYIIAGEASGDLHGKNLMRGLYESDPGAVIRFWGGSLMEQVYKEKGSAPGGGLVRDYNEAAVIGFSSVILNFRSYLRRFRLCCKDISDFKPDVVILIDYPGFNFKVAQFAHNKGLRVFYYIAPKVWASRESRLRKLRNYVDKLFIVFPFEKSYFEGKGIDYVYAGNPLIDAVDEQLPLCRPICSSPYIALLAGSRRGEVSSMMPVYADFADKFRASHPDYRFIIAGAPSRSLKDYEPWLKGREEYLSVEFGQCYSVLKFARAAVINSGTASLEACLTGTPQVVCYSANSFNYRLAKQIIKIDLISLGNLILGRKAFRELIQFYFTPDNLFSEVSRLIWDEEYRSNMLSDYSLIRESLGSSGASKAVASEMVRLLK